MAAEVSARARVAVLTNNPALLAEDIDLLVPELRPVFGAHIYASGGFKLAKPDPRCFRHCLSLLGAHPEETLLIDDLAENVAGAEAAGLKAHLYTTEENLAVALREHGVLA
jgi:putative hydrolase of the HAD superfamily